MAESAFRRAMLPYRNAALAALEPMDRALARALFSIRHLPRMVKEGWPAPLPPLLKRSFLHGLARAEQSRVLVETGTYLGDTTWWLKREFSQIHTIEVDPFLYVQAVRRFRRHPHVTVHLGDSGQLLPAIVPLVHEPALYWLDGHYSAGITGMGATECPITAELAAIYQFAEGSFVVAIDDARCFGHEPGYPSIAAVLTQVAELSGGRDHVSVENDMIIVRQSKIA